MVDIHVVKDRVRAHTELPLPEPLRHQAEKVFGRDLADVRVERGRAARRATESLGTLACAADRRILIHPEAPAADQPAGLALLAHEIVHLAQQTLPSNGADHPFDVATAEAEAHAGARALLTGRRFRCRIPVAADRPMGWNEPGHYYTAYLLALAAGFDDLRAFRIAVYCQLPDLAQELDAAFAGLHGAPSAVPVIGGVLDTVLQPVAQLVVGKDSQPTSNEMRRNIQRGLHCLTGTSATAATEMWVRRLKKTELLDTRDGLLEFGLGLHALGDSFAHRDGQGADAKMCCWPLGHASFWPSNIVNIDMDKAKISVLDLGEGSDNINTKSAKPYLEYVAKMYDVMLDGAKRSKSAGAPKGMDKGSYVADLFSLLTTHDYEREDQIQYFRNCAVHTVGKDMRRFAPNNAELRPFAQLRNNPGLADVMLTDDVLRRTLVLANRWATPD